MTLVRIIEWRQRSGPFTRWAGKCFEDAGCKVEVSYDWANTGPPADLIYSPVPGLKKKDIPIVTNLEGFGSVSIMPEIDKPSPNIKKTFENSKVLLADPNMLIELRRCGIEQDTIMMPNPAPPITIPTKDSHEFTVFFCAGCWSIKKPEIVIQAAKIVGKEEPKIRFVMSVGSERVWRQPLEWLELDNVEFLPSLPYDKMLEQYALADIVVPFSQVEILPFTVFEGLIASKPVIVNAIGKVQSVHRKYVEEMVSWFGTPSRIFDEKWRDKYESGEGNHYLHASSAEELAKLILELYNDQRKRYELGNNALEWINAYSQDWKPKDKGKKILELVGIK